MTIWHLNESINLFTSQPRPLSSGQRRSKFSTCNLLPPLSKSCPGLSVQSPTPLHDTCESTSMSSRSSCEEAGQSIILQSSLITLVHALASQQISLTYLTQLHIRIHHQHPLPLPLPSLQFLNHTISLALPSPLTKYNRPHQISPSQTKRKGAIQRTLIRYTHFPLV